MSLANPRGEAGKGSWHRNSHSHSCKHLRTCFIAGFAARSCKRKPLLASGRQLAQLAGKARIRDDAARKREASYATAAMARLLALLTTAAAYVTQQPKSVTPGRTSARSKIVLGPQSVPQVPYSPPGAEQGQHMYVDIYQALYRDRIMLVGNFLDEEQANSLIA